MNYFILCTLEEHVNNVVGPLVQSQGLVLNHNSASFQFREVKWPWSSRVRKLLTPAAAIHFTE